LTEAGHHLVGIEHGYQRRPGPDGRQQHGPDGRDRTVRIGADGTGRGSEPLWAVQPLHWPGGQTGMRPRQGAGRVRSVPG
jgi:hypothetical protein